MRVASKAGPMVDPMDWRVCLSVASRAVVWVDQRVDQWVDQWAAQKVY